MASSNNSIKNWANKLPFGFKEFTKAMSNENRLAIASLLREKNELRFTEIQEILNLQKNLLSQHLKILLKYGIIRRTKSQWTAEEKVFKSRYKLNPIYKDLIDMNIKQLSYPLFKYSNMFLKSGVHNPEEFEIVGILAEERNNVIKGFVTAQKHSWYESYNLGENRKWLRSQTKKK